MRPLHRYLLAGAFLSLAVLGIAGCAGSEKLYPVSGKVTNKEAALTAGAVSFVPDASKGNKSKAGPTGTIGSDGSYSLTTNGKSGAPLGWYKVTVSTSTPGMGGMGSGSGGINTKPSDPNATLAKPGAKIDPKYTDPTRTDVSIEVVASPAAGAYDVKLR